jgi:hypothetical protein
MGMVVFAAVLHRLDSVPSRHDQNEGLISQFKYVFLGLAILVYVTSVFFSRQLGRAWYWITEKFDRPTKDQKV